jgi:hypothetical protein
MQKQLIILSLVLVLALSKRSLSRVTSAEDPAYSEYFDPDIFGSDFDPSMFDDDSYLDIDYENLDGSTIDYTSAEYDYLADEPLDYSYLDVNTDTTTQNENTDEDPKKDT